MALNYLDGKNLCDCDTDGHALLVARSGGQSTDLFITDDDHLRFLVIFANEHGRDLQSLFSRGGVNYQTCFCKITDGSFKGFLNSNKKYHYWRDFITSNDISEIEVSFPEKANYGNKEIIKDSFINIIQKHVVQINDSEWLSFIERASSGVVMDFGIDLATGTYVNLESEREKIIKLTREDFIKSNVNDSFEPDFYVNRLLKGAEKIGEIDGHSVWFNPRGFYFYWNKETDYLLEAWLTYPAYPYGWFE
ncbi:hypothetical protein BHS57_22245 [Salmonella enterica]|nr:hypothetical protein [Salmonella enterica]ELF1167549.1 hypothetical protein [Salmonella enterica]HDO2789085.1 hypothetical protein [Salmonella enterica subsp. enterica serovar Typhimurium]HEC6606593.1 hypothetical protein [Salmonella enterica subsp. enterica serovar Waycross]